MGSMVTMGTYTRAASPPVTPPKTALSFLPLRRNHLTRGDPIEPSPQKGSRVVHRYRISPACRRSLSRRL